MVSRAESNPIVDAQVASERQLATLAQIEKRVLWLATSVVHHANHLRETPSGVKVGGHQASSASMVSIMTALYFAHLRSEDRVSVKPHASPVLHAVEYLLGRLDRRYLPTLRQFGGLQSYPSRSKDPDQVDFSTGSVGIGATAPIWSALANRYVADHFAAERSGRAISLVGDAELDEGAVWEALVDPMVPALGELLWVVDVNRQSLDRVVPDLTTARLERLFAAAGWQTITLRHGRLLEALFASPGGEWLRQRLDTISNADYLKLMRAPPPEMRDLIAGNGPERQAVAALLADLSDEAVRAALRNLGGHDLAALLAAFAAADASPQPTVILAYTLKAWRLPTEARPDNHSTLLSAEQWHDLAHELGADADDPWATFATGSDEARMCEAAAERLERRSAAPAAPPSVPAELGATPTGKMSTQQAFGRLLLDLDRNAPEVARRVVTVSADVASSTNLGSWINRAGIWAVDDAAPSDDSDGLIRWRADKQGRHIELGIAEVNLVSLLGELGATWSRDGQPLLPIGTLYDPFLSRALEPWSFGIYAGGQSLLVGTPSGVTLAPEGGAHQSVTTPSIVLEQPRCVGWEPAFAQDLKWTLLHALDQLGRTDGTSAYFRLSTRPLDQGLARVPNEPAV